MGLYKPLLSSFFFSLAFLTIIYTSQHAQILQHISLDTYQYPTLFHHDLINPILKTLNEIDIENDLRTFIKDLPSDRYYKSDNGYKAAMYLKTYLSSLINDFDMNEQFEIAIFNHEWKQPSVILKMKSELEEYNSNTIIIGCHIDSINFKFYDDAPGVDDNLSGVITVIQTIKHILEFKRSTNTILRNSLEFHFYAAEEMGSLGSINVFNEYRKQNNEIVAMLQQDMTGYIEKSLEFGYEEHFGIITDYSSKSLMSFTKRIITEYCTIPYLETTCNKICSDHISALMFGYPSVYVLESKVDLSNPFIHSTQDTIEHINFSHMLQHVKLTLAFAIELSISDEITRVNKKGHQDTAVFRYLDFMIILMMHYTKRFVYAVLAFACAFGSFYLIIEDKFFNDTTKEARNEESDPVDDPIISPQKSSKNKKYDTKCKGKGKGKGGGKKE